jgi:hypothetical protein
VPVEAAQAGPVRTAEIRGVAAPAAMAAAERRAEQAEEPQAAMAMAAMVVVAAVAATLALRATTVRPPYFCSARSSCSRRNGGGEPSQVDVMMHLPRGCRDEHISSPMG